MSFRKDAVDFPGVEIAAWLSAGLYSVLTHAASMPAPASETLF